jgi:hypothetical protein
MILTLIAILVSAIIICTAGFVAWRMASTQCKQCTRKSKCRFHTLTREHDRLKKLYRRFESQHSADDGQMKQDMKQLSDTIVDIQAQLRDLNQAQPPGDGADKIAENAAKIASIEAQLSAARDAPDNASATIAANAAKIASIEAQLSAARDAPDNASATIEAIEAQLSAALSAAALSDNGTAGWSGADNKAKIVELEAAVAAVKIEVANINNDSITTKRVTAPHIQSLPTGIDTTLPPGWGGGIHAWDVYVNSSISAGKDGKVASLMKSDGNLMIGKDFEVGGNIHMKKPGSIFAPSMNIQTGDRLMLMSAGGVHITKNWGGAGMLTVSDKICINKTCIDENTLKSLT